ncbi:killer cell lectin-like receptor 2 [Peromyscus eremicus]|uniref:killer cell lectin-like receptor 2 n=1 Tax=Peromyscus eremicus TaxID=42410 RepID=UPI0027DC0102|nr:killer cell lectin-like receptor 2 [Peromyscus eremicus]
MSDEEITYTTVRFHKSSSELQNRGRADETQGSREAGHKECSVPWHLIAIPLGVICSILLVAVAVLVTHIFQYSQEKHELQRSLNNLHQEKSTMQNDSYLKKEMFQNKSTECDTLKDRLSSLNRTLNRCYQETKVVLDYKQHRVTSVEGHWFCYGIKCYYFIMNKKNWTGCKQTCHDHSLSLLKIEDENELKFLQLQMNTNNYWIGLKYDERKGKWLWIGDGPFKLAKPEAPVGNPSGQKVPVAITSIFSSGKTQKLGHLLRISASNEPLEQL